MEKKDNYEGSVHSDESADKQRVSGVCSFWHTRKGFGIITADSGEEFFALREQIKGDALGFQYLDVGEKVAFTVGSRFKNHPRLTALRILPMDRPLFEPIPKDYRENVLLERWDSERGCGFCRRDDTGIGGSLILSAHDVITEGIETLRAGSSRLWVQIAPPLRGKPFFRAVNAEILLPEELKPRSDLVNILTTPSNHWERLVAQATRL